ncbi:helix-hairpin-helix domain-containing protein [Sphingomonas sp.]|uniref:helix-hairpin-helix domain-containing protein n=1 Tax=Sphingomonas sp. TaxID=28214 RepID=UPI003D6CCC4B
MADQSMITPTNLIIIAVFAVIVLAGIWWGVMRNRDRGAAQAVTEEHREAVDTAAPAAPVAVAPSMPEPVAPQTVTPPPVAPAPPPLADEPIVAAAAFDASPASLAADMVANTPVEPTLAGAITQLKGLGPKLAAQLAELGVTRVDQIAAMSPADIEELDAKLGTFKGRIARDRWVEQARLLTAGDRAAYEAEFGKLGG